MGAVYRFAGCELDPGSFSLRRDGRVVHVEPQVLDVLAYLLAHRDRLVPRRELLEAVWGDHFVSESALSSRLMQARHAVGDDGRRQAVIATVHGRGYRFVAPVETVAEITEVADAPDDVGGGRQEVRYCVADNGVCVAYAVTGLENDNPIWGHWLRELARDHALVRYDERGCGLSDWDVPGSGFEDWVDDLELVVGASGVGRPFALLGISQGAAVAVAYAVRHPEQVARLVLVGGYARGRMVRAQTPEAREEAALDLEIDRVAWRRADDSFRQLFASQFLPDAGREQWDAFNRLLRSTTSTDNVVTFLDVFAHIDVTALAPRMACPTLVVHSRGDERVPRSQARELAGLLPRSRLVMLSSRNHILTADEPAWPVFLAELRAFLVGPRGAAGEDGTRGYGV